MTLHTYQAFFRRLSQSLAVASLSVGLVCTASAALPVAVDDTVEIFTRKTSTIITNLLANDTDADGANTLQIIELAGAAKGKVALVAGGVRYTPGRNFDGIDTFQYSVSDGTDTDTATVTVRNAFLLGAGNYAGPIGGDPANHENSGFIRLRLTGESTFTMQIQYAGESFRFVDDFVDTTVNPPITDGTYSVMVTGRTKSLPLVLNYPKNKPGAPITGSFDGTTFSIPRLLFTFMNRAAVEGRYTLNFAVPAPTSSQPQGIGFATMNITALGASRVAGRLPDGTAFTSSTFVNPAATALGIYTPLYRGGGSIFGSVTFPGETIIEPVGTLTWKRPASRTRLFRRGFTGVPLTVSGSEYVVTSLRGPLNRPLVTNTVGDVNFSVIGDGIRNAKSQPLVLPVVPVGPYRFIVSPEANPLRVVARVIGQSGLVVGTFRDPVNRRTRKFQGIFNQADNTASGFFIGSRNTGDIFISVVGAPN